MRTLLPDPPPAPFEELLRRRREWGADRHDEVWEGVLHMAPAAHERHADLQAQLLELLGPLARAAGLKGLGEFNLGEPDDHRIPDAGLVARGPGALYVPTAALVVEIVSPGDESWDKLDFYAAHAVDELVIVDPATRRIDWLALGRNAGYEPAQRSRVIDLGVEELGAGIEWPD